MYTHKKANISSSKHPLLLSLQACKVPLIQLYFLSIMFPLLADMDLKTGIISTGLGFGFFLFCCWLVGFVWVFLTIFAFLSGTRILLS